MAHIGGDTSASLSVTDKYGSNSITVSSSFSLSGTTLSYTLTSTNSSGYRQNGRAILLIGYYDGNGNWQQYHRYDSGYVKDGSNFPSNHNLTIPGSCSVYDMAHTIYIYLYVACMQNRDENASETTGGSTSISRYQYYSVTFSDGYYNSNLKTENVISGGSATPPANPTRSNYTFTGWSGSYTNVTSDRTITATWKINYTKCGVPTNLSLIDNNDNTLTFTGTVGANGTQNNATGIRVYVTYNGTDPDMQNYTYVSDKLKGSSGETITHIIPISQLIFKKNNYKGTVKVAAYTIGTQSGYNSDKSAIVNSSFTYYTKPTTPSFIRPSFEMSHAPHNFSVEWTKAENGINNEVEGYILTIEQKEPYYDIWSYTINDPEIVGYEIKQNLFEINGIYQFRIQALTSNDKFKSDIGVSSLLNIIELEKFNDLIFRVNPVEIAYFNNNDNYTNVLHIDDKERILIDIEWDKPEGINNIVNKYNIYLLDDENNEINYWKFNDVTRFKLSNKFISKDSIQLFKEYKLRVNSISSFSDSYQNYDNTSEFLFRVYPASGIYVNLSEKGNQQLITLQDDNNVILEDVNSIILAEIQNKNKVTLFKRAIGFKKLDDGSWIPLKELFHKNNQGKCIKSDISFEWGIHEILLDINNEIITDINNENIEILK